jgi:hypothetical protein
MGDLDTDPRRSPDTLVKMNPPTPLQKRTRQTTAEVGVPDPSFLCAVFTTPLQP